MDETYYQHVRHDLVQKIPIGSNRVLDVGCAEGATGFLLKQSGRASEVVGIELISEAARNAESRLDHVIFGDLEQLPLDEPFISKASFDYILCGDVLEHLKDPWLQLKRLSTLLKPNAYIIISLPNVRHYSVVFPLLFRGDWKYLDSGILDATHLRFFTKKTALLLVEGAGLQPDSISPVINRRRDRYLNVIAGGIFEGFFASQWVIAVKKCYRDE